jgi:hypothetical protein
MYVWLQIGNKGPILSASQDQLHPIWFQCCTHLTMLSLKMIAMMMTPWSPMYSAGHRFIASIGRPHLGTITETNRIYLVLFGMQNRRLGPYLAATNRTPLFQLCGAPSLRLTPQWMRRFNSDRVREGDPLHAVSETNRIQLVLFGMKNRTCAPYLAAINRILISLTCAFRGPAPGSGGCARGAAPP